MRQMFQIKTEYLDTSIGIDFPCTNSTLYAKLTEENYDGDIDAADALIVLKADVKLTTLTTAQKKIADVNGDGVVDAADAILILKCNAGLIDSLE